ncbi:MAG: LptF/LptG family permease [Bacteroidota bacterium]|jgi:lipopolysaccharide export system permease protein|nr:LptF/LptG family permease [Bacteroidota bacterium]
MKVIDWFILKKFLSAFFFVVLILVAIICVIDITEKNDDFIKHSLSFQQVVGYYINFIPYIANLLTPITVFIATVFVTAKMASHTEIIAILSSGISFRRMMVPYMLGALLIAMISFFLTGWVIPDSNKSRIEFEIQYTKRPFNYSERDIHMKVAPESYMYMENYNNHVNVGYKFTLETIKDKKLVEKLSAKRIEWKPDDEKWMVQNWTLRTFDGLNETLTRGEYLDTTLNILPKDFSYNYKLNESLTLNELDVYIQELRERGADDVENFVIEKYIRYMSPFTVIILTFIGLIVSARKARGGAGFQIALGFFIAFIFIIFYIMSRTVAEAGSIHPLLGVWIPNIVFSIVGLVLYKTVPR